MPDGPLQGGQGVRRHALGAGDGGRGRGQRPVERRQAVAARAEQARRRHDADDAADDADDGDGGREQQATTQGGADATRRATKTKLTGGDNCMKRSTNTIRIWLKKVWIFRVGNIISSNQLLKMSNSEI